MHFYTFTDDLKHPQLLSITLKLLRLGSQLSAYKNFWEKRPKLNIQEDLDQLMVGIWWQTLQSLQIWDSD